MKTQRFAFALERLEPGDWARFERFASQFLVFDYGALRSVATPSGDLGRDSELFSPEGDSSVLLQYSVTKSWDSKIKSTAKRIRQNFPSATILVYVTNQQIGAAADGLKKELRKDFKLVLDIHDKAWFLDRLLAPPERQALAEKLAEDFVDPYLAGRGVVETKSPALSEFEAKAAVLQLQIQWEDDYRGKGLTKLSFEALVKSVLRETSTENRMKRQAVRDAVQRLLPNIAPESVNTHVESALDRLDKKAVRHWRQDDEVCLNHEEVLRVRDGLAQRELRDQALLEELKSTLEDYFDQPPQADIVDTLCVRARRVLDLFLLRKGEEFAAAVTENRTVRVKDDALDILVTNDFGSNPDSTGLGESAVVAIRLAVTEVLQRARPAVQRYLREIADGYTLFAFLRAVPDVQKTMQKIFSDGEIWLDTSVILPVMAETLLSEDEQIVSRLLRAALDAGFRLRVTSGVIEEVERHVNRCFTYERMPSSEWVGGVPFLYAMFALAGKQLAGFTGWITNFCGRERPRDDVAEYLLNDWDIEIEDLTALVETTPEELRWEVERIWREAHEARRHTVLFEYDPHVVDRLVQHDVECFLGVLGKRKDPTTGELGYVHWWLTFDKTVRDFEQKLWETIGARAPKAPVISPDFLADYLAVGPARGRVAKATEANLPVAMFDLLPDHMPIELIEIAGQVRQECGSLNERLLLRRLRDTVDTLKRTRGVLAHGGFAGVRERLETAFKSRYAPQFPSDR
ncbi:MAG: hypothetical protein HZA90_20085 [Verrucomicrobia bacterium]|nr:hypothetical protein [Verrucomicrobiota bacterium]